MKSVSADQKVASLVLSLLLLCSFGLRWCAYWVTGLARMVTGYGFRRSKSVSDVENEILRHMEPALRKVYSEAASSLSSEELLKLQDYAMQQRRTVHYPPRESK